MQLDDRSWQLLQEVIVNPAVKNKDLEDKFNLSRRQIGYSFEKINDWLAFNSLPKVERTKQGQFKVNPLLRSSLYQEQDTADDYVLSEKERAEIIVLILLARDEELSLFHLESSLDVSKNTVLRDLKEAREIVKGYRLTIQYSRQSGYRIKGREFSKRKLLNDVTGRVIKIFNGKELIKKMTNISEEQLREINRRIENVETTLNLKFTDEKLTTMPYILIFILRRIKAGKLISSFMIHFNELSDTKEYMAAEEILFELENIPMEERLFITLHLLTTSVSSSEFLTEETMPELISAIDDMLTAFEKNACIILHDKEQLQNKILLHLKPAYYRIKYKLTVTNALQDSVSKEFEELHHIVKKSTEPLVKLIGAEIPEGETTYLTMLIGGWLTRQGDSLNQKVKAIIVCPNGVSVSRLMASSLREVFPEFIFLDTLSVREFYTYKLNYDIVFSPVFLETEARLFIVKSFIERNEKHRLRKQVMMDLNGYVPADMNTEHIIDIVDKYATIRNRQELAKTLQQYFNRDDTPPVIQHYEDRKPDLSELITPETITLKKSVSSWEEAVRVSAEPLLQSGKIEEEYIQAMMRHYNPEDPYIVIGEGLAIPHAGSDEGVNEVAMTLLRLKEPVEFAEGIRIHIVVVIAAPDKRQHFRALTQLMMLAGNKKDLAKLIDTAHKQEIHTLIRQYSSAD